MNFYGLLVLTSLFGAFSSIETENGTDVGDLPEFPDGTHNSSKINTDERDIFAEEDDEMYFLNENEIGSIYSKYPVTLVTAAVLIAVLSFFAVLALSRCVDCLRTEFPEVQTEPSNGWGRTRSFIWVNSRSHRIDDSINSRRGSDEGMEMSGVEVFV